MASTLTITEALAEVKTLGKRMDKKRLMIGQYLVRDERLRDPFEKDGGSPAMLQQELQALGDLELRLVRIRLAIQAANHRIRIVLGGQDKSIAEWLTWRKEIAPTRQSFLSQVVNGIARVRKDAQQKGMTVGAAVAVASTGTDAINNLVVNVDELAFLKEMETLEEVLGSLDGQLSLKNATELVTIED